MIEALKMLLAVGLALAGILVISALFNAIRTHPIWGISLAGVQVAILGIAPDSFQLANVSGINISALDVFSTALILAAISNGWSQLRPTFTVPAAGLVILLLYSVLHGVFVFSIGTSVNEARQFIWMFAGLAWSVSVDWTRHDLHQGLSRVMIRGGWVLTAVAILHGAVYGFASYGGNDLYTPDGEFIDGRILTSAQSFILLFCAISTACNGRTSDNRPLQYARLSTAVFLTVVLLTQQRTVWVVGIVCVAILLITGKAFSAKYIGRGLFVLGAAAAVGLSSFGSGVAADLVHSATDTATYNGRSAGWSALLAGVRAKGGSALVYGQPFGSGYDRLENGLLVTYSPHNWYLNILLRTGFFGLAAFLIMLIFAAASSVRPSRPTFPMLITIGYIVYGFTYNATWYASILLGIPVVVNMSQVRARDGDESLEIPFGAHSNDERSELSVVRHG